MFLYFVELDGNKFGDADLDRFKLRYAIESKVRLQLVRSGPNGKRGFIVADSAAVASCKYLPESQTWVQRFDDPQVWIGYNGTEPPHPLQLARRKQLAGRPVRLPDGKEMLIPIARRFVEHNQRLLWSIALPQALKRDESGKWVPSDVVGQYRRIWDLLMQYCDAAEQAIRTADVADGESVYFQFEAIDELAIGAITANYRMGPDEVEICGQYDQRVRGEIIAVLRDEATREAWIKKKLATLIGSGGTSSDGPELSITESTPDTAPVSPSSLAGDQESIDDEGWS